MTSNALALCMRHAAACQRLPIHPRRNHARGQQPHLCKRGAHCRPAIHFVNVVSAPGSTQPAAPCSCACSSSSSSWHASRMQGTMQHWPMTVTSILQYAGEPAAWCSPAAAAVVCWYHNSDLATSCSALAPRAADRVQDRGGPHRHQHLCRPGHTSPAVCPGTESYGHGVGSPSNPPPLATAAGTQLLVLLLARSSSVAPLNAIM